MSEQEKAATKIALDLARKHIRQAENEIKTAVVVAFNKLHDETGLYPRSVTVDIIDAATYGDSEATVIGDVRIRVGRL